MNIETQTNLLALNPPIEADRVDELFKKALTYLGRK